MVSRSAYYQLRYSPLLLAGTVAGMLLLFLAPPVATALSPLAGWPWGLWPLSTGLTAWGLMSASFVPLLREYRRGLWTAPLLSVAGLLYTLMTLESALSHYRGRRGWKGRRYRPGA